MIQRETGIWISGLESVRVLWDITIRITHEQMEKLLHTSYSLYGATVGSIGTIGAANGVLRAEDHGTTYGSNPLATASRYCCIPALPTV